MLFRSEKGQSLQDYIKTGIEINAKVSKELLCSIFMATTPLHDGAVIIQGDKVACASAYFPPTSVNLSSRYGARHRAALGISEVSDALTIVVSEETSAISISEHGTIVNVDDVQRKDYLRRVILNESVEIREGSKRRNTLTIIDEPEMTIEKMEKKESSMGFKGIFSKKQDVNAGKTSEELDMKVPLNNRLKYQKEERKDNVLEEEDIVSICDNTKEDNK